MKPGREDIAWLEAWHDRVLPDPVARQAYDFQMRLLGAQSESAAAQAKRVARQAEGLLAHAMREVPWYRETLAGHDPARLTPSKPAWRALPLLERAALQENAEAFVAQHLPQGQRIAGRQRSSGSTGTAVEVQATNVTSTWQKALALRAAVWARRDFSGDLAVIRRFSGADAGLPDGVTDPHWGDPEGFPFRTGRRHALEAVGISTDAHLSWLERVRPDYVMTYPSILNALVEEARHAAHDWRPTGVSTLGETLDEETRAAVEAVWGLSVDDVYSAEECGVIAIQCPSHGSYHVQSESVLVELLDDDGRAVPPGAEGRVVVTTLANAATPLIRYALGDRAVAGRVQCGCGRPGPLLARILGRERNLMVTGKGRFWPSFGTRRFRDIAPISAQQFRQTARETIEMAYVSPAPLTGAEEGALRTAIAERLPVPMTITLRRVDALERAPNGKFETFVCAID